MNTELPVALGDMFYEPRKSWSQYNLHTFDVKHGVKSTNYQAIFYQGNFVRFAGKHYYVYPHEDVLAKLDPICSQLGMTKIHATPRTNFTMVYGQNQKAEVEANFNREGIIATRISANYTWDQFDPGDGKPVQFGATMANTIDGTGAFSLSPYSLREVCSNGMKHLASVVNISNEFIANMVKQKSEVIDAQMKRIQTEAIGFDGMVEDLKKLRITHNRAMPIEVIAQYLSAIKNNVSSLKLRYREMIDLQTLASQAEQIAKKMPVRLLEKLDWLKVEEIHDKKTDKIIGRTAKLAYPISQWNAFNTVTNELSHNKDRAMSSTDYAYAQLDKILVRSAK